MRGGGSRPQREGDRQEAGLPMWDEGAMVPSLFSGARSVDTSPSVSAGLEWPVREKGCEPEGVSNWTGAPGVLSGISRVSVFSTVLCYDLFGSSGSFFPELVLLATKDVTGMCLIY